MDYAKKHRESTHSLLMEKWGYGKTEEVIQEIEVEDLEGAEDAEDAEQQPSDKMSAGDFKSKSIEQAKAGSEAGMDPKENAIISQLIDILKVAAKEGNIASGNINTLLNKVAAEAKKIS